MNLGADFYDNHVQAIRPSDNVDDLEDRFVITILRNGLRAQLLL